MDADPNKYRYSGYGTGLNARPQFSLPDVAGVKMLFFYGIDNSSSVHVDYKKKGNLALFESPTKLLYHTSIIAKAKYYITFRQSGKNVLTLSAPGGEGHIVALPVGFSPLYFYW